MRHKPTFNRQAADGKIVDDKQKKKPAPAADTPAQSSCPRKRVTASDVARCAGVSQATVSIVLSDRRDIAIPESTRERIRQCADEMGYLPSRLGEGFLHGRSKLIGVMVLTNAYLPFLDCVAGLQESLAQADYLPLFLSSDWLRGYTQRDGNKGPIREAELPDLNRLLGYQVEGVLYFSLDPGHTAACMAELARRKIPAVVLGGADTPAIGVDAVGSDNEALGRMAAEHLLSVGCTSFAYGQPVFSYPIDEVVCAGFVARLKKAGHSCRSFIMDEGKVNDLPGMLSHMLRPPAGVFATRENVAALALRSALSLGWTVPQECAVMSMCKSEVSLYNALPITTANRNSFTSGQRAAELLVQRIKGFAGPPQRILTAPTLEVRTSTVSDVAWKLCSESLLCRAERAGE